MATIIADHYSKIGFESSIIIFESFLVITKLDRLETALFLYKNDSRHNSKSKGGISSRTLGDLKLDKDVLFSNVFYLNPYLGCPSRD